MSEIKETQSYYFKHYGFVSYKIQFKESSHGLFQRHIWLLENGETKKEKWVPSV